MSGYYVGGETDYYTPTEPQPCPCSDGGLVECYCGGPVDLTTARDWLEANGVPSEGMHAADVVATVEAHHPDGFEGFYDEAYGEWASRRLRVEA